MSSNEEYLDSLLKAVTSEGQMDNQENSLDDEINMETSLENSEQSWQSVSADELDKMLKNVAEFDVNETTLDDGMHDTYTEEDDSDLEEKAFSDPGALFFEGEEEETEEDPLFAIEDIPEESISTDDHIEESNLEEDVIGAADLVAEEDVIGAADLAEEDVIGAADLVAEEDSIGAADLVAEEDIIGAADLVEEEVIGATDLMAEEDIIGAADRVEESFEDEGFKEISDLLASSSDGDDEMFAMLEGVDGEESEGFDIGFFDTDTEEPVVEEKVEEKKKEKKKKEKKKKAKKQATGAEENTETEENAEGAPVEKEKKKGVFARFVNFLMEEDEDEESEKALEADASELLLGEASGENAAILEDLDKEDKKSDKKEKKKGKKEKKGKKGKAAENTEDGEDNESGEEAESKGKKKKAKKGKKKKEKEIEDWMPEEPSKKISVKKIEVTAVFCLTILAAILLAVNLIPPTLQKNDARDAFYAKDYEKVIESFYGEDLSESDSIMYDRAYTILRVQRKIDGYNNYMNMGKETEALNQLIEGVIRYKEIYADAEAYKVTDEVNALYQTICDALQNKYGITAQEAEELYMMEDKLEYTLKLESIINGTEYSAPESAEEEPETEE